MVLLDAVKDTTHMNKAVPHRPTSYK